MNLNKEYDFAKIKESNNIKIFELYMPKPTFTIGVFAVIFDEKNRILFCHRTDYDLWNLPGGCMEHGETPWDCILIEEGLL